MKNKSNFKFDDYFKELEHNYPVNHWRIDDIYIWPYIRIKLYFFLLSKKINQGNESKTNIIASFSSKPKKHIGNSKIIELSKAIISNKIFFSKLRKKKIVFVGSHFHRVQEDGVAFNRFFDSMIKSHQLENDVYFLEYQKIIEDSFNKKTIIHLEKQINASKKNDNLFKSKKELYKNSSELYRYESFLSDVKKDLAKREFLQLQENNLISWVRKIKFISNFYIRFFKKVSPEKLIFCGYYGWDNLYAAIYSANKLNIKTIDFQHGPQTNHMVFSGWNKIPKLGYNLMPKEYWVWDQESKLNLEKWSASQDDISVKLAGHPYLQYKHTKENKRNLIVFTMQTFLLKRMIPQGIIKLMKEWDYKWVFRLHPRNSFSISEVENYFNNQGVDNTIYEIEFSDQKPLSETLAKAVLHFTCFSGCMLEARSLGVSTILIDDVGYDMFKNYIDNDLVFYINPDSKNMIQDCLNVLNDSSLKEFNINQSKVINPLYF